LIGVALLAAIRCVAGDAGERGSAFATALEAPSPAVVQPDGLVVAAVPPQADSPMSAIAEAANRAGRFIFPPSETTKTIPDGE